jgi:hypothetical protein
MDEMWQLFSHFLPCHFSSTTIPGPVVRNESLQRKSIWWLATISGVQLAFVHVSSLLLLLLQQQHQQQKYTECVVHAGMLGWKNIKFTKLNLYCVILYIFKWHFLNLMHQHHVKIPPLLLLRLCYCHRRLQSPAKKFLYILSYFLFNNPDRDEQYIRFPAKTIRWTMSFLSIKLFWLTISLKTRLVYIDVCM